MANSILTPTIIAREALMQLNNNMVFAKTVFRNYSKEFKSIGSSVEVRRPLNFDVTKSATVNIQDVTEGKLTVSMDTQAHVAWKFSSVDLTLSITEYSERYIKPAMINLANTVDVDGLALGKKVHNWAGTAGQTINSFADFAKGPERLDKLAVPGDARYAVMSPADFWGLVGSQTALSSSDRLVETAYERARLGRIGGVEVLMAQNVATLATGTRDNTTPLIKGASQEVTYATAKNTMTQTLDTDGWDNSATIEAGMVFTIADVYAVNPITGATLDHLAEWTVVDAVTADGAGGTTTLTISPAIITSGPYKTASASPADNATITVKGSASSNYPVNLVYHRNAFALVTAPLIVPDGVSFAAQETDPDNGLSVRVVKWFDGTNDEEKIRLDILYGWKCIDPRLATRLSGTS